MATKKKLLQAAAGQAGGAALNVEDVFSTHLYQGVGLDDVDIQNGINLGQGRSSGSVEMSGNGESLYVSHDNAFDLGTGDFTIEFWVNGDAPSYRSGNYFAVGLLSAYNAYLTGIFVSSAQVYGYYQWGVNTQTPMATGQLLEPNLWYHIAFVRYGNNFRVYINGTSYALSTSSTAIYDASQLFSIGKYTTTSNIRLDGYISNVRFSNTARYTANFTPPTANFTSDSNTILLTCVGEDKTDLSSNSFTVSEEGTPETTSYGPFDGSEAGEGGLVWIKNRPIGGSNLIFDTERGVNNVLETNANFQQYTYSNTLTSFNSNGFTVGSGSTGNLNRSGDSIASWTFRKAPKFFDVVTYTGNGTAGRTVSHNLGSTPGCIIIKGTSSNYEWPVYHRGVDSTAPEDYYMWLNYTSARTDSTGYWNDTAPTSTQFTLGNNGNVNASGQTYVAYLFAHNDGDGTFGPDADADIIKCGSYTGTGSSQLTVDLGFEPQWLLVKRTDTANDWILHDTMRGFGASGNFTSWLEPNTSDAEATAGADWLEVTSTGFSSTSTQSRVNASGGTYIYIAIRRGPMRQPESGTEVFAVDESTGSTTTPISSGFPVDQILFGETGSSSFHFLSFDRMRGGKYSLTTSKTDAEVDRTTFGVDFDSNTSVTQKFFGGANLISWMWKRAPNYFDVVAYTGDGVAGRTVSHNLGVAPEMVWIKARNQTYEWVVHHKDVGFSNVLYLNLNLASASNPYVISTSSDTDFTTGYSGLTSAYSNQSGTNYIAYLFATLAGVSKVGSFTHTSGSATNVDCGFSSGARFVIYKKSSAAGSWYVFDTERGIVSGNDPFLFLDTTDAEYTIYDVIDPLSSGFTAAPGLSSGSYIFYAIA